MRLDKLGDVRGQDKVVQPKWTIGEQWMLSEISSEAAGRLINMAIKGSDRNEEGVEVEEAATA